jgi:hypothetical protein
VKVWSISSKGNKKEKIYERKFQHDETREIRLYGLKGKDEFDVEGEVDKGLKVRIIGGPGNDDIKDKSKVRGLSKRTMIYDNNKKNEIEFGTEARNRISNRPVRNTYTYMAFNYNKFIPLAFLGFNPDESLVVGAGFMYTTYGFQKFPNASSHKVAARYASATNALEFVYDGHFTSVIGGLDLNMNFTIRDPKYSENYFGLGNETDKASNDVDFHRVRIGQLSINPELSKEVNNSTFSAGLFYQKYSVEDTPGRYIDDLAGNGLDPDIFESHDYTGVTAAYQYERRTSSVIPTHGIFWRTDASLYYDLGDSRKTFNQFNSELSIYWSFRKPYRTVFAFRVGGSMNIGDYEFFQASSLGGKSNLRGFRETRFSGDASLYQNSEIRIKLFNFTNYISKGEIGIIAFNDFGRVWLEGENSNIWHHGYGGGLWISPFSMAVLTLSYEWSKDEKNGLFVMKSGFLF